MQTGATETVQFHVQGLEGEAWVTDLSNALNALNGVGNVAVDGQEVSVRYDPEYSNPLIIRQNITGAGYEVSGES